MASSLPGLIDDSTVNEHSSSSRSWPSSGSLGSYRKSPCHKVPPARGFRRDRTLRFDRRDFDGARLERNLGWPRGGAAAVALRHARRGWPNGECPVRVTGPASPVIALAHRRRAERNQPPRLCWWWTRSTSTISICWSSRHRPPAYPSRLRSASLPWGFFNPLISPFATPAPRLVMAPLLVSVPILPELFIPASDVPLPEILPLLPPRGDSPCASLTLHLHQVG